MTVSVPFSVCALGCVRLLHAVTPNNETAHAVARRVSIRGVRDRAVMMPGVIGEVGLEWSSNGVGYWEVNESSSDYQRLTSTFSISSFATTFREESRWPASAISWLRFDNVKGSKRPWYLAATDSSLMVKRSPASIQNASPRSSPRSLDRQTNWAPRFVAGNCSPPCWSTAEGWRLFPRCHPKRFFSCC